MPSVKDIYRFDELTWPEINEAVAMGKIPILPTGSVEQHNEHMAMVADIAISTLIAQQIALQLYPSLFTVASRVL
mgnify:CR=1 FL=1